MSSTSKVDSSRALATISSSVTEFTRRLNSVSTRNAGVPVSNHQASSSRLSNSSRMSKGL